jgi:hypothetical protein
MPKPKPSLKNSSVKAIFTNLLFVIGVILMVIGFVNGTTTAAKLAFFDQYPLHSYEENRCDNEAYLRSAPLELGIGKQDLQINDASTPAEIAAKKEVFNKKMEAQKEKCIKELDRLRKLKQVEDTVSSISFLVAGVALTLAFRQFIFGKK